MEAAKPTSIQHHKAAKRFHASATATAEPRVAASEPELMAEASTEEMMEKIEKAETTQPVKELAEAAMSHHNGELIIIETNLLAQVLPAEADVVEVDFLAEVISTEPGRELVSNIAHTIMDIPNLPNKLLANFMQKIKDEVI